MLNAHANQETIRISHPHIRDCYVEKYLKPENKEGQILIVETHSNENETEFFGFDSYLVDLLTDLQSLKAKAETKVGAIDRIDIRTH